MMLYDFTNTELTRQWHNSEAARAALVSLTQPAWGYGSERWRNIYRMTRALNRGSSSAFYWALHHNPLLKYIRGVI